MRSLFALIALVSSAFAYQVITPGNAAGWTTAGPNQVTWQRVGTDATNFTMLLVNQNKAILPSGSELLAALVDGNALKLTVSPPSGGFVAGTGYQVNFVKDPQDPTSIYAQSSQFAITQSNTTATATIAAATTPNAAASSTDNSNLNPTDSSTPSPSSRNGADRITAAGSTSLIFAVLAAFIL